MSRKGISGVSAILLLIVIIVIGAYLISIYPRPQPQGSNLEFSMSFPPSIIAEQTATANVTVTNAGTPAKGVTVVVTSDAVSASSESVDINTGSTTIPLTLTGKDVQDGTYPVLIYLRYSDQLGSNQTASKGVSIYLLPAAEFTDVKYIQDFWHPFGKSSIGRTSDNTTLLFKIHGKSSLVIYHGLVATATLTTNVPGLSITPQSIQIMSVGPNGMTEDYRFNIRSDVGGAPPGTYTFQIQLFSKDNQMITQLTESITVNA